MNLETSRTNLINIASAGVNAFRWMMRYSDIEPRFFLKKVSCNAFAFHFSCLSVKTWLIIIGLRCNCEILLDRYFITGVDNTQVL